MYASQWFLTVFTAKFPLYLVFRVLDVFLFDGFDAIFQVQPIFFTVLLKKQNKTKKLVKLQCGESLPHCYFTRLNPKRYCPFEPLKKEPFLILSFSIARNSQEPKSKRIFEIQKGILEGHTKGKLRLYFLAFDHVRTPPSLHFLCSKFSIF